jgi:uncharacterized protein (UPF0332 family)
MALLLTQDLSSARHTGLRAFFNELNKKDERTSHPEVGKGECTY